MSEPTPPGSGDYGQVPPPSYGMPPAAPSYAGAGAPYKGQALGLPPTGPNSLASQWKRLVARIIDGLILAIPGFLLFSAFADDDQTFRGAYGSTNPYEGGLLLPTLIGLVIAAAYEIYFLTKQGATPGKKILGMRVAQIADGANPDTQTAAVRFAVGNLPQLVPVAGGLFSLVNVLWCFWDPNRQCIHDKPAKTVVVNS